MLKITGGSLRGRIFEAPPHSHTRPTQSKLREAIFSSLFDRVTGARVLDLFAGSGALGLEALSRGADSVVFVEEHRRTADVIRTNLKNLDLSERAKVIVGDAKKSIIALLESAPYDIVFADPPYEKGLDLWTLEGLPWEKLIQPSGSIWIESSKHDETLPEISGILEKIRQKTYGDTVLSSFGVKKFGVQE